MWRSKQRWPVSPTERLASHLTVMRLSDGGWATTHRATARPCACSWLIWAQVRCQHFLWSQLTESIHLHPFPVAAARVWNSLPEHVTSAPSVAVFRSHLKTHLFDISYPDPVWLYSVCAVTFVAFGHYNRPCYLLTYFRGPQDVLKFYHLRLIFS